MDMTMFNSTKPGGDPTDPSAANDLSWTNVGIGFLFVLFDALLSTALGLGIGRGLLVAAARCIIQLTIMSKVLGTVFESNNIFAVMGIALLLENLAAIEGTFNKAKRRYTGMFPFILLSMLCGTIPISIVGERFAMQQRPFWKPDQYIPILGMLLGNAISAIGVGVNNVTNEFTVGRDKIETALAMGASRFEACRPVAVEALKLALLPTMNQMSIIGLISIPGMMTGAIVGGKSVEQAARLQMIIMFMISASSALSTLAALFFTLTTLVDASDRIRTDRIDPDKPWMYRARDKAVEAIFGPIRRLFRGERGTEEERRGLLSGEHGNGANHGSNDHHDPTGGNNNRH